MGGVEGVVEWSKDRGKTLASIFRGAKMATGWTRAWGSASWRQCLCNMEHKRGPVLQSFIHENIDGVCVCACVCICKGQMGSSGVSPYPLRQVCHRTWNYADNQQAPGILWALSCNTEVRGCGSLNKNGSLKVHRE